METEEMKTTTFAGRTYRYVKLESEKSRKGACAFKMVGDDKFEQYMVFTPWPGDLMAEIETPNDGRLIAFCPDEPSALAVTSSIRIATAVSGIAHAEKSVDESELAAKVSGFDTDRIRAEVNRLRKEGRSYAEIREEMGRRVDEFKVAKPSGDKPSAKQEGGEW